MSVSHWLDRSKNSSKKQYDACIIGAGISGLSTAYWLLKKDPNLKISLLEKGRLAFGASGRNAGFITCGSVEHFNRLVETYGIEQAHEIWQFSEDNLKLLKNEIIQDDQKLGFEQKGSFSLASTEKELLELKKTAQHMKDKNIPVAELDASDIEKRLGAVNFAGGIHYVSDASISPTALCEKIYSLVKDKIDFYEHCEVSSIETLSNSNTVKTDLHQFESGLVILATNAYSSLISNYFSDKIYATKGQILCLEPQSQFMEGPCYANFVLDYFRQLPTGELLIGGFRQLEKDTEVGFSDHITPKIQQALQQFIDDYLPQFKNAKVTHRWAGIMGFSADGQPMIGSLPDQPQVFFLGGFTAHGLGLAFHSAQKLVSLIFGESIPDFISARRF